MPRTTLRGQPIPGLLLVAVVWIVSVAALAKAQVSITVTPANTHQTWRFYGGNVPNHSFDDSSCSVINNTLYNQALPFLIDAGVNDGRIEIQPHMHIESVSGIDANDNAVPFSINASGFAYDVIFRRSGICPATALDAFAAAQAERNAVSAAGVTPQTSLTFITFTSSTLPAFWWTGAGSIGKGVDEMTEAYQETIDYIQANYGFCPDFVKFNEPDGGGTYANSGSATSWTPGVTNSFVSRISADAHCPNVKFMGPEDANADRTLSDLSSFYGLVTNSEANLAWITYHSYGFPSDHGAAIYAHAAAEGKQTAMTEAYDQINNEHMDYSTAMTELTSSFLPTVNIGNVSGWDWLGIWGVCYRNPGCLLSGDFSGDGVGIGWDTNGASAFYLQPWYYVFRQFSKYVQPGYVRVDAATSNGADPVTAWKRPDGTQVVMVVNTGSTQSFAISGLNNQPYAIHKLDPTMCTTTGRFRCTPDDSATVLPTNGGLTLSMPPTAIWTLTELGSLTLSSLNLSSNTVTGGSTLEGTVTLSAVAPPGGATVTLLSSNASVAMVPSSVTVPAGASSANFSIATAVLTASIPGAGPTIPPWRLSPSTFCFSALLVIALMSLHRRVKWRVRLVGPYLRIITLFVALGAALIGCSGGADVRTAGSGGTGGGVAGGGGTGGGGGGASVIISASFDGTIRTASLSLK